jgi:hypothetical protein
MFLNHEFKPNYTDHLRDSPLASITFVLILFVHILFSVAFTLYLFLFLQTGGGQSTLKRELIEGNMDKTIFLNVVKGVCPRWKAKSN